MQPFDPNAASSPNSGAFGLTFTPEEASVVLIPAPWEVTTSYKGGTAKGPGAILEASRQVDLHHVRLGDFYKEGISLLEEDPWIAKTDAKLRSKAEAVIAEGGQIEGNRTLAQYVEDVNAGSTQLNEKIQASAETWLDKGKIVGLVGGDHSTPLGLIAACHKHFPAMGVLQIDAHLDLRKRFEGFEFSHASIMQNVVTKVDPAKLVQVGIRDFCDEEVELIEKRGKQISVFYDRDIAAHQHGGGTWDDYCRRIIAALPQEVYVSFDIDGLDPSLCPHTGTPVPGGLQFNQVCRLFELLVENGKRIIGFDVNEVAPGEDEWDANVGARVLFELCGWSLRSRR
jgi:agmatinase